MIDISPALQAYNNPYGLRLWNKPACLFADWGVC